MAQKNHTTNLTELLLQCVTQPDPMLSMLEPTHGSRGQPTAGCGEKRTSR